MNTDLERWAPTILQVCKIFDEAGIRYHADASSSLFIHGFLFAMDDFDVTVEWNKIEQARALFESYTPTPITGENPEQFQCCVAGFSVDVMAYASDTGIGPADERTQVQFNGYPVWSKVPAFYLQRMRSDHPIRHQALAFFDHKSTD